MIMFKNLDLKYLNQIHLLIAAHQQSDSTKSIRKIYSKDFLYWYLKQIKEEYRIGMIYKKKLIGFATAIVIRMIINQEQMLVPHIGLLCIQSKVLHLKQNLINELKDRLKEFPTIITNIINEESHTSSWSEYIIPINVPKLKIMNLIPNLTPCISLPHNPLHLMIESDISSLAEKLNHSLQDLTIKVDFDTDFVKEFFLPKKNIVYSFVVRNGSEVTDFVSIYKSHLHCLEKNRIISVGNLSFYFCNSMPLTYLLAYLLDKLILYKIDLLAFTNQNQNDSINLTKYPSSIQSYYMNETLICPDKSALFTF